MKGKGSFRLNYESQIRISLVFLIVFLILLNFGTEYLLHQAKRTLRDQIYRHLSAVALCAGSIWESSSKSALKRNLLELSFDSGIHRISFLSTDGELLMSSREAYSETDHHIFWGVKPEVVTNLRAGEDDSSLSRFFSDFYQDNSGTAYLSCYLPLRGRKAENRIWVMVEEEVSTYANIERMAGLNVLARVVGIFIAAFVTMLLVRSLLRPYRTMIKKAKNEQLVPADNGQKADGELDVAVGIFEQVISELKKKEKILQELYRQTDRKARNLASYNEYILKAMTSGMIICDEGGRIIRMNDPARMILHLPEEHVLGKHYAAVFEKDNHLLFAIEAAFSERCTQPAPEILLPQKDGESVHLALSSSAVKDEDGKMLGVVLFMTDLTEIKRLEEEVAFKDKMATLGEMSAGLAHELRNSMGAILGFVKLLKRENQPASQNLTVDAIFNEAMSMEAMLQRFLAFAKPYQLKIDKVDLVKIVRECLASVEELIKEKKITFELDQDPNLIPILGDPLLLKQSFQNLIQNSIDAMPGGGKLNVNLRRNRLPSDREVVSIEISDTGRGMPKEIEDKIFNPFFSSKEKGTGLGLSLVKKFISLHNGKIELKSEPGWGTTFTIYLPLRLEPDLPEADQPESEKLEVITSSDSSLNEESNPEDMWPSYQSDT